MLLVYYYNVVVINAVLVIQIRDRFCDLDLLFFLSFIIMMQCNFRWKQQIIYYWYLQQAVTTWKKILHHLRHGHNPCFSSSVQYLYTGVYCSKSRCAFNLVVLRVTSEKACQIYRISILLFITWLAETARILICILLGEIW